MAKTRDFASELRRQVDSDPELAAAVEREAFNANLAIQIYENRKSANLTQKQLADRIGTQQSVIARLEDASYSGHSLKMLWKIAKALNCTFSVEFFPKPRRGSKPIKEELEFVIDVPATYPSDQPTRFYTVVDVTPASKAP